MKIGNYDEFISLGSQCNPGLTLKTLCLKNETYPFDWIRSNSKIIYDVLLNGREKYLTLNSENISDEYYTKHLDSIDQIKEFPRAFINLYGQFFTHYYESITSEELINKYNNYFERFYSLLNSNKRVLFIHGHEEYIYHKKSRDDRNIFYDYLCKINDLLKQQYQNLNFTILNIDVDNNHENYGNIINLNMEYNMEISDNAETHNINFYQPYRNTFTQTVAKYLYSE